MLGVKTGPQQHPLQNPLAEGIGTIMQKFWRRDWNITQVLHVWNSYLDFTEVNIPYMEHIPSALGFKALQLTHVPLHYGIESLGEDRWNIL